MMLFKLDSAGWPIEMVNQTFDGTAPSGHVVFKTWTEVDAWKSSNEDKRPRDVQASTKPQVPSSVELWKFRAVCQQRGILDAINAWIAAQPEPPRIALTAFMQNGTDVPRDAETVEQIAKALGKSDADIDALFIAANSIDIA